ncbi:MAG: type II toxin-antitoxin system HicB family antitoxin [Bacteroidales bacterium]
MKTIEMTAVFEPCADGGYIAYIEEIPGINTQGNTIDEARENLSDAISLVFEERRLERHTQSSGTVKKQ